jgi:sulfite reductase (NADPH) flavoprotein alpha-component
MNTIPTLPDSAPFTPQQRSWLNGYFAAILSSRIPLNSAPITATKTPVAEVVEEDFPWHDASLPLNERLELAKDRPHARRLMSAMAQLNCGACGYLCQTYAEAIASGAEQDLTRCTPGGSETAKALRELVTLNVDKPVPQTSNGKINGTAHTNVAKAASAYDRNRPFIARLKSSTRLTHAEAPKDTRHVVIDLLDSGIQYEPGDSLGVLPQNCAELVGEVLRLCHATPATQLPGTPKTLGEVLSYDHSLTRCPPDLLTLFAQHATTATERSELEALKKTPEIVGDVADLLTKFPSVRPPIESLLGTLGKLQPRLYSISSSLLKNPGEVHLTVGIVRYESAGRWRNGVASHFLGVRSLPGDDIRIFAQTSKFRLPTDPTTPIIMVGPGTGIAPFRSFLQQRQVLGGVHGKSWLFFGNQQFHYDFLYKDELSAMLDDGSLSKLDLAFSRDQIEKTYVQHKMLEHGAELWRWLNEGAHFYVCGDARRMALDVHSALLSIACQHGKLNEAEAKEYFTNMVKSRRYQKDVY